MKNKFLIIFIIIVALIIGIYFIVKKTAVAPIQNDTQNQALNENLPMPNGGQGMEGMSSEEMMEEIGSEGGGGMPKKNIGESETITNVAVIYTDSGFSPSSIEIKKGQIVQFINKSNGGMWVASGPHPAHTAYPEFDVKKNIPSGETYEFTFDKVGEWKYHNHSKASAFGVVIVK